jgi:hypothetical protein
MMDLGASRAAVLRNVTKRTSSFHSPDDSPRD